MRDGVNRHGEQIMFLRKSMALLAAGVIAGALGSAHATVIFSDSFDYGGTTTNIGSVGNWSSGSSVLKYDHDGGLEYATLAGETGGAMWLDYTAERSGSSNFTNFDLTPLEQGDAVWMAALFQYVSGNNAHSLAISGGTVSAMGVTITGAGDVVVTGTLNTTVSASNDTQIDLGTGTYLMLLRYTKGSGSSPVDSKIDLWINPAPASLGTADWTLDSDDGQVKWGRDGNALTGLSATPSQQGRIDEIRIATSLGEINLVPEPASMALLGLGGLMMLRRRSA
jgi:hypothetical protein